ncbi:hypothetical protein [Planctomicrobium piriforme]|uniref:Uncharacterized protein n=1 Tax=Planctomicrobium piriforme TaxID=1576369 RepID=A0A1I3EHK4_9PLAN|nr:hypothetical protein [Planctomicrobium piriforme]SFH98378.1 hypothetical protein SAMN05421753_104223 [Planctomicrobium piriforme]
MPQETEQVITPRHQWTNGGDKVLILKVVNNDLTSHGGFVWPKSGPVRPAKFSREPDCSSGGLFGWAWGFGLGEGKFPDFGATWIVFAAHPDDVIDLGDKVKAVPNDEACRCPEVVFCGAYSEALKLTIPGHVAWVKMAASGAATASGASGAATASGDRGAATASGDRGAATASGDRGAATASGDSGAATASGASGAATASGDRGAATASGDSGAATASGYSGAATASGDSGAATASGYRGAATASGDRGAAVITGECSTIEVSATGLACVTSERFAWRVRPGAVLCCRFGDKVALMKSADVSVKDGEIVKVQRCEIVSEWSW